MNCHSYLLKLIFFFQFYTFKHTQIFNNNKETSETVYRINQIISIGNHYQLEMVLIIIVVFIYFPTGTRIL